MDRHAFSLVPILLIFFHVVPEVRSNAGCSAFVDTKQSFNLSIVSKRNSTGKWVTNFVAKQDSENETDSVVLDLKQKVYQCGGRQIISIQGIISENPHQEEVNKLLFHSKCGKNVAITNHGLTVQKLNVEDRLNSVVLTNRPIERNELFEVRVDSKSPKLGYFLGMGFTTLSPFHIDIPAHINQLREGSTWVLYHDHVYNNGAQISKGNKRNIDQLQVGDRIGIKRSDTGTLLLYINGSEIGPMASNLPEVLYGAFEIYGDMGQYTLLN